MSDLSELYQQPRYQKLLQKSGRKGGSRPKPRALSLEQRRALAKRKQEGAHWTELVSEFGVSQSTVYNVLKEMMG